MNTLDRQKLKSLRDKLTAAQAEHLVRAADNPGLPTTTELRKIADIESAIGAVEALLEGHE